MRPATAGATLAGVAAFTLPYLAPAASLDAALAWTGLPTGDVARTLAFAYLPAAWAAAATGLHLRAGGASPGGALVPAGIVAAAALVGLLAAALPPGASAQLAAASATGLLALALFGLGLCALCLPPDAARDEHAIPLPDAVPRPRPVVLAEPGENTGAAPVALAA